MALRISSSPVSRLENASLSARCLTSNHFFLGRLVTTTQSTAEPRSLAMKKPCWAGSICERSLLTLGRYSDNRTLDQLARQEGHRRWVEIFSRLGPSTGTAVLSL